MEIPARQLEELGSMSVEERKKYFGI